MKKILVLHTGGTIAMSEDKSGKVVQNVNNPLMTNEPEMSDVELVTEDIFNLPSPHITLEHMLILKNRIQQAFEQQDFQGIVITHGTDTLEETAYFLDLTRHFDKPVVITGAMRSSNEPGTDGYYNFLSAIRVASDANSNNRGVLVVMNAEVHAARLVTKTHTTSVSTFQTPTYGPIGIITRNQVLYHQTFDNLNTLDCQKVTGRVPIIKAYSGMTGELFDLLNPDLLDGLVIEALGAGNLPPAAFNSVKRLLKAGVPIVLTSRCFNGLAEPIYAYQGGGAELYAAGIMFAQEINSQKARIKLIVGLNAGISNLREFIEN
ncbi:MAG: asparaginase [Streptococcaceae bacterium]|jgi:L-asparaginase|nr:asparaginase [Streptococcaceae bacterium]